MTHLTHTHRFDARLKRTGSRYNRTRRERPEGLLLDERTATAQTLRRHRFGTRGGAYVYMFYRLFPKRPFVRKVFNPVPLTI